MVSLTELAELLPWWFDEAICVVMLGMLLLFFWAMRRVVVVRKAEAAVLERAFTAEEIAEDKRKRVLKQGVIGSEGTASTKEEEEEEDDEEGFERIVLRDGFHWIPKGFSLVEIGMRVNGSRENAKERPLTHVFDLRSRVLDVAVVALATKDGKHILLDASVLFRITDPVRVVVHSRKGSELFDFVEKVVLHNVGSAASQLDSVALVHSIDSGAMKEFLVDGLAEKAPALGFRVENFFVKACRMLERHELEGAPKPIAVKKIQ